MKNLKTYFVALGALLITVVFNNMSNAQDGEALFKAKCNACHIMGKDGTGPNLQGVKAHWEGEEEFLYEWVQNSPKVIAEGLSERAQEIKDWSPTVMPVQDVTLEEAIAIIDYVDAWEPEVIEDETDDAEAVTVLIPDYKRNLNLFYVLIGVIFILLLSIKIVSKSTATIIRSDFFRKKIAEKNSGSSNAVKAIAVLLLASLWSTSTNALTTEAPQFSGDANVWLYVENSDLYVLLIIALLLLGFLLHTVNMFFNMLRIVKPKKVKTKEEQEAGSLTRALTGAVPIEEEHKIDLGHDYDGIRELDNPMPPWWLAGFFVSIVFAVIYMFHYHVLGTGDLQHVEYEKSVAQAEIEAQAYREKMAMNIDETNATLMTEPSDLKKGKELFLNNCAVCHQENGAGEVGPNLTDDYWIYGGEIGDIYKVIRKGAPNGMPEHQSKFNPIQIQQVSSYVMTLDYVSPADGGKEPEGEKVEKLSDDEDDQEDLDEVEREDMTDDLVEEVESITED